jgi:hypothetical protein
VIPFIDKYISLLSTREFDPLDLTVSFTESVTGIQKVKRLVPSDKRAHHRKWITIVAPRRRICLAPPFVLPFPISQNVRRVLLFHAPSNPRNRNKIPKCRRLQACSGSSILSPLLLPTSDLPILTFPTCSVLFRVILVVRIPMLMLRR